MEITVTIKKILEPQSGVSSRNGENWVKNSFVGETQGNYPKMVCFTVMGGETWEKMNIKVGGTYNVSFDPESREWNGKFFTDLRAWKAINLGGGQQQGQQAQAPAPTPQPAPAAPADDSELPF